MSHSGIATSYVWLRDIIQTYAGTLHMGDDDIEDALDAPQEADWYLIPEGLTDDEDLGVDDYGIRYRLVGMWTGSRDVEALARIARIARQVRRAIETAALPGGIRGVHTEADMELQDRFGEIHAALQLEILYEED